MSAKRILLLCATHRGTAFAKRLFELYPEGDFVVATFRPESWEPDYLPGLEAVAAGAGARLVLTKRIELEKLYGDGAYDLLLAVSWRYRVSREVWSRAALGAYVFHDSLLPKYRGFSPTVWAIINGETVTGVSLIQMVDSVDGGRLIDQERVEIGSTEYIGSVMDRVTAVYIEMLGRTLPLLLDGPTVGQVQDEAKATYGCKRQICDNRINWQEPAGRIYNLIRACAAPYSGAFCSWGERRVMIWSCYPPTDTPAYVGRISGRVVEVLPGHGVRVLAGDHSLLLGEVQVDGGPVTRADLVLTSLTITLT